MKEERIEEIIRSLSNRRTFKRIKVPSGFRPGKALVLTIADAHFGKGRIPDFDDFLQKAISKTSNRNCEFVLCLLGDEIEGNNLKQGHNPYADMDIQEQLEVALSSFEDIIGNLGREFPKVKVLCTPGNHGNFGVKSDNWDLILYRLLERSFREWEHVDFTYPKNDHFLMTYRKIFIHHGKVKGGESALRRLVCDWALRFKSRVFLFGHWHRVRFYKVGSLDVFQAGTFLERSSYGEENFGSDENAQWFFEMGRDDSVEWLVPIESVKERRTRK